MNMLPDPSQLFRQVSGHETIIVTPSPLPHNVIQLLTVSIFPFAEVQKLHSRSACRLLPHEDIIYAYMQELDAVGCM